jgi:hypothetical protein
MVIQTMSTAETDDDDDRECCGWPFFDELELCSGVTLLEDLRGEVIPSISGSDR